MAQEYTPFVWNNFTGGQSDDDYSIGKGQFTYSENIDVKRSGFEYGLTPKCTKVNFVNAEINDFLEVKNSSGVERLIYFGTSGKIFNDLSADNTPVYTIAGGIAIVKAFELNDYIYFVRSDGVIVTLWRETKTNVVAGTFGGSLFTPTGDAIPSPGFGNFKVEKYLNYIFISIGKILYRLSSTGVGTIINTFPDDIVGITTVSNTFKIYLASGGLYYVNGIDTSTSTNIKDFKNLGIKIRNVTAINGIDYILAGTSSSDSEFYYMNGVNPSLLKRAKRTIAQYPIGLSGTQPEFQKNNYGFPILQVQDDIMLVDVGAYYMRLTHFGNKNDNFPRVFSNEVSINSQGNNTISISSMYYWKEKIYFYYYDGTNTGVDYFPIVSGSQYQTNGFIFTEIFDGGIRSLRKVISTVYLGYGYADGVGNSIKLSYSIDGGSYIELLSINDDKGRAKNTIPEQFFTIQFRIELTGTAKFRELRINYKPMENV